VRRRGADRESLGFGFGFGFGKIGFGKIGFGKIGFGKIGFGRSGSGDRVRSGDDFFRNGNPWGRTLRERR